MMCSIKALSRIARLSLWICLAHLWILISSLVYVSLEGCDDSTPVNYLDVYLSRTFKEKNVSRLGDITSSEFLQFKDGYDQNLALEVYWRMRKEFNDPSKVYIFVLSTFTTLGNYGLYPQTWNGRLFYVCTLPMGLLLYAIMLHNVAVEVFDVFAFSVVFIFPRRFSMWTIDQRELYEKMKVTFLSILLVFCITFIVACISILNNGSYLDGLYATMNLVFTIEVPESLISLTEWNTNFIAFWMTITYFVCMLFVYIIVYSVFILFRFNNLNDITRLFDKDYDTFSDVESDITKKNDNMKELYYYNAKEAQKNYDLIMTNIQNEHKGYSSPRSYDVPKDALEYSDESEGTGLAVPHQRKTRKKKKNLQKLKMQRNNDHDMEPEDLETPNDTPIIEVTQASPTRVPENENNYFSDIGSNVSTSPESDYNEDGNMAN